MQALGQSDTDFLKARPVIVNTHGDKNVAIAGNIVAWRSWRASSNSELTRKSPLAT